MGVARPRRRPVVRAHPQPDAAPRPRPRPARGADAHPVAPAAERAAATERGERRACRWRGLRLGGRQPRGACRLRRLGRQGQTFDVSSMSRCWAIWGIVQIVALGECAADVWNRGRGSDHCRQSCRRVEGQAKTPKNRTPRQHRWFHMWDMRTRFRRLGHLHDVRDCKWEEAGRVAAYCECLVWWALERHMRRIARCAYTYSRHTCDVSIIE